MRALGTIILAAIVAGLVAGTVQVQMAISFKSGEEFIGPIFVLMLVVAVTAVLFAVTLALGGGSRGIRLVAVVIFGILVVGLAVVEYLGQANVQTVLADTEKAALLEIVIPALLAIAIEWWFVQRHLKKAGAIAAHTT